MNYFHYSNDELYAEEVPIQKIASQVGTPFYIYSYRTLQQHFFAYDAAFGEKIDHLICFAVKANSNLAILNLLSKLGAGADIVSGGELYRALKAGVLPERIVYAGVGKTRQEMEYALRSGILLFNVESWPELELLNKVAGELNKVAPVALRVNPDISADTHPYITTGLKKEKFGIDIHQALEEYKRARSLGHVKLVGAHVHIGSQITKVTPFMDSLKKVVVLIQKLRQENIQIQYLDIGGGLGITYKDEAPPSPQEFIDAISPLFKGLEVTVISEPGRVIVGNAGALISKVLYVKRKDGKKFFIIDAGMNDLMRPTLYKAYHEILPLHRQNRSTVMADIVGPICESGDFFARDRKLPEIFSGELLAVMSAGAYGFSMSGNYNSRPRVPEILVKKDQFWVIRQRETYEDLIHEEMIPDC